MRKLNWTFLVGLIVVTLTLGVGTYFVHGFQVRRNASAVLDRARAQEAAGKRDKAAESLKQYLSLDDRSDKETWRETWRWYARLMDESTENDPRRRYQAFLANQEAARQLSELAIELRCGKIAMEFGSLLLTEAVLHLESALDRISPSDGRARAEVLELLGDCRQRQSFFTVPDSEIGPGRQREGAEGCYRQAIEADEHRTSAYRQLARLQRNDLRRSEASRETIETMVQKNSQNGLAYLYRFLYNAEFDPPAKEEDLAEALRLLPDDKDVLLAAARHRLAENRPESQAQARAYLEKAMKLDPANAEVALLLAGVEGSDGHADKAKDLLRKAYDQKPDWRIAYQLATVLIGENQLEGEGGAKDWAEKILSRFGYDPIYRLLQARIKMQEQDWPGANQEIQTALGIFKDMDPKVVPELEAMSAECYRRMGYDGQARAAIERAVSGGAQGSQYQLQLARALLNSEQAADRNRALQIFQAQAADNPALELDIAALLIRKVRSEPGADKDANWKPVEDQLGKAERLLKDASKYPRAAEMLTLLRVDMWTARRRPDEARRILAEAEAKDPRNLAYRLARVRLAAADESRRPEALAILDQAERDLGPGPEILMARLAYWGMEGGDQAKAEVARLAERVAALPKDARPACLGALARTELMLGERELARKYLRELAALQPSNIEVVLNLFDLALDAGDDREVNTMTRTLFELENPGADKGSVLTDEEWEARKRDRLAKGAYWRYAEAARLLNREQSARDENRTLSLSGSPNLQRVKELAELIAFERPNWWGGPLIEAQLIDLGTKETRPKIEAYQRVFDMGNSTPAVVRRIVGLLEEAGGPDKDQRIAQFLQQVRSRQGAAESLKLASGIELIRRSLRSRKFDEAISRAVELFGNSDRYTDHHLLAGIYVEANRLADAEREFERAKTMAPAVPECWLRYIEFLTLAGKLDKARAAIQEARSALPADKVPLTLARCLTLVGDHRSAQAMLRDAMRVHPQDPETLRFAAMFYLRINQVREAMSCLDELSKPAPGATPADLTWADRLRAEIYTQTGRPDDREKALSLIEKNLKADENSALDRRMKAVILAAQEKVGDAIKLLADLKKESRLEPTDQLLLARLYLSAGDGKSYEAEITDLLGKDAALQRQAMIQILSQYTSYLISGKRYTDAETQLKRLSAVDPQGQAVLPLEVRLMKARNGGNPTPELRDFLLQRGKTVPDLIGLVADLLAQNGFTSEAEAAFKEFVARGPEQPQRELALAAFLATVPGRAADAMEHFQHASKTCTPEQVATAALPLYDAPSVTEAQRKQVEAWLTEAFQKRPDMIVLANKLAAIWIRQGRVEEAEGLYRKLLERNPANPEALNNLAWVLALQDPSKTDEARELVDQAIRIQGASASLRDTRAVVLIRSGKNSEAIEELTRAAAADPRNFNVVLHLAWAHHNLGKTEDARKAFQRAVELGWSVDRSDPMERAIIAKLRQDLGL